MTGRTRVAGIDVLRGVVMVLMAIDHVRLYGGVPAGGTTAALFFTRWVTHFCAPAFAFFAGTSAFLYGRSVDRRTLSRFLVTRGLLLVLLELTVIKLSWGFNLNYSAFTLAGVIWMLGWCMVLMSLFVPFSAKAVGIAGLVIIIVQPLAGQVPGLLPASVQAIVGPFWEFVYPSGFDAAGSIAVLYVIVPWIGVMAAGYGFGLIATLASEERDRWCLRIGVGATLLFLAVAIPMALGQENSPDAPPLVFRVLGQNKYPASPPFLLMTLGPTIALIPFADRARGGLARVFETFGRVPLFYYLLHVPAIHLATLVTAWMRGDGIHYDWYASAPFASVPPEARWSLWQVYLVFAIVVTLLYFPCAWYAHLKERPRRPRWAAYV